MKRLGWLIVLVSVAVLAPATMSHAQLSVYGEATADYLNNGPYTDFLTGGTAGVTIDLAQVWHDRITVSADVQGNFVFNNTLPANAPPAYSTGETYETVTVGPRLSFAPHFFKLAPYVQANVGFGRYHDPFTHSVTDNVFGAQGGVTRRLTPRFDAVLDYSYSRYGYNAAYYNPQTFSVGAIYHFVKR